MDDSRSFSLGLTNPPLIAAELRLLFAEHLAIVRFVFDEEREERSEDEGKVASAE